MKFVELPKLATQLLRGNTRIAANFVVTTSLMIAAAILEVATVLIIGVSLGMLLSPSGQTPIPSGILEYVSGDIKNLFVVSVILVASNAVLSVVSTIAYNNLSANAGAMLSSRIYRTYVAAGMSVKTVSTDDKIYNTTLIEAQRIVTGILSPALQLTSRAIVVVVLFTSLLFINVSTTVIASIMVLGFYLLTYIIFKKRIYHLGIITSNSQRARIQLVDRTFHSVKISMIYSSSRKNLQKFEELSQKYFYSLTTNQVLAALPRFAIELLIYGGLLATLFHSTGATRGEQSEFVTTASIFGLAALKLIPAMQHIYQSAASIQGNIAALENFVGEFKTVNSSSLRDDSDDVSFVPEFKNSVRLTVDQFEFYGREAVLLSDVELTIDKDKTYALIGPSGSGKTTLVDILAGLYPGFSGSIEIDGEALPLDRYASWRQSVSYVDQSGSVFAGSLKDNIVQNYDHEYEFDEAKLRKSITLANLDQLLESLPEGIETEVGDKGGFLSGGQKQRLALARALYRDANLLILDEPTSALDAQTETAIMNSIRELHGRKTIIIIAHRLSTIVGVDKVLKLANGTFSVVTDTSEVGMVVAPVSPESE